MGKGEILLMFLAALVICWGFGGFLLRVGFSNKRLYNSFIIFPAILGTAGLVCASVLLNYAGLPMRVIAYILLIPVIWGIWCSISQGLIRKQFDKIELTACLLATIAGMAILAPYLLYNALNPYNDAYTYLCIADYLIDHAFLQPLDVSWANEAVMTQPKLYQMKGYRMGAQYLLAFFTALFRREYSIEAYLPVVAIATFLYTGAVWLFCRYGLTLSVGVSRLATIIVSLHWPFFLWPATHGVIPQTYGMVFLIASVTFLLDTTILEKRALIVAGLLLSGVILTYSEGLPFLLLCIFCLIIQMYIESRINRNVLFKYLFFVGAGFLFAHYGVWQAVKAIKTQLNVVVGWNISYTLWQYWTQFLSIDTVHFDFRIVKQPFYAVMNMTAILVMVVLLRSLANRGERVGEAQAISRIITLSIPFVLVAAYFILISRNPWDPQMIGQTWNTYKLAQYVFFLVPPLLSIMWYRAYHSGESWNLFVRIVGILTLLLMVFVASASIKSARNEMRYLTGNSTMPFNEYLKVRDMIKSSGIDTFNLIIPTEAHKHRQMIAYFLRDRSFRTNWLDDIYIFAWMEERQRNIPPDPALYSLVYKPTYPGLSGQDIGANLLLVPPGQPLWQFSDGWYGLETNNQGSWWRWSENKGTIVVNSPEKRPAKLEFDCMVLDEREPVATIEITSGKNKIVFSIEPKKVAHKTIEIPVAPDGIITFEKIGGGVKVATDSRILGLYLANLKLSY